MRKHSCFVPPDIHRLHLIKSGYAVQIDKNKRKLRFLFLFPKNLIITKLKIKSNCAFFHTKGIIRLGKRMVTIESKDENDDAISSSIAKMKKSLSKFEKRSTYPVSPAKKCPEASLALMIPRLKLTLITTVDKRYYHLLFSSRVEFQTWKDLIENHEYAYNPLNIHEGTLDVHVHQIKGVIADTAEVFLTLQVDYLGGFFTRVFTSDIAKMNKDLIFDQKFELSLNCSQTLRINAYKRIPSTFQDFQFFAMGTFEVNRQKFAICCRTQNHI
ncbi:Hypothetical predicted protein [Octopus vulgaris]|uniref:PH domain-containing protein n=1 Tax=Octopus vulgaris TaxID=6645 RepID=A0AA36B0S2_OCTVU|nr:Hypothetical predicted protein [Octopus vulgaris]